MSHDPASASNSESQNEHRTRALFLLDELERLQESGAAVDVRDLCDGDAALEAEVEALAGRLNLIDRVLEAPLQSSAPSFVVQALTLRIVRPLGRGGQGCVNLAFDEALKREVAVKTSHWKDADSVLRLRKEAEIASRLNHPGIVPVFGAGVTELGLPFLTMRYVPGVTLESLLAEAALRSTGEEVEAIVQRALRALSDVCRTVAFAHRQGIVHCDVKPGNVLLGDCGETALLDWGLAAPFASNDATAREFHISHGSTLRKLAKDGGTARFMSPERAKRSGDLGPWTDIYSLGVILDMIAHGESEPSSCTDERSSEDRSLGSAPSPYPLDAALRRELLALADVACAIQPSRRPKSAEDLAHEIDRILDRSFRSRGGWRSFLRRFRRRRS